LFVLNWLNVRLQNSFLKDATLFKPVFGDASKMGHLPAMSPVLVSPVMHGGFYADLGAMLKVVPDGIGGPHTVLKKFVR